MCFKLLKRKKEHLKRESSLEMFKQNWLEDTFRNIKIKTMIDFDRKECNSMKFIALKGNTNINVTSQFFNGKMLMFAKILPKSFLYDMTDVFCFPTEEVKMIYDKYYIKKCHLHLNLTNTNSFLYFFNFICKKECNIRERVGKFNF